MHWCTFKVSENLCTAENLSSSLEALNAFNSVNRNAFLHNVKKNDVHLAIAYSSLEVGKANQ